MLDDVDSSSIIIALVTGVAMLALIALSVLFARYRKRNKVVVLLAQALTDIEATANPKSRLTARPPLSFTSENFDAVIASEGRIEAAQLLLDLCHDWAFASPITEAKWTFFTSCVVPLEIWDEGRNFDLLKATAGSCRAPLNDALREIIRGLAGDGGDGEWLCAGLASIDPGKSVAQAAGPSWFPARFTYPVQDCDQQVCDAYDANVLPNALRLHAGHTFELFGDALNIALPSTAFREGETKGKRRKSIAVMATFAESSGKDQPLMVRYDRDKCVKQVKRMKAKVVAAQKSGKASRPCVSTIGDSLRASVCATNAAGMRSAWEHLAAPSAPWTVVRLKNKARVLLRHSMNLARISAAAAAGKHDTDTHSRLPRSLSLPPQFSDAALNLVNDNAQQPPCLHANLVFEGELGSILVEVQVHLFSIMEVKKESHKLYEVERAGSIHALRR